MDESIASGTPGIFIPIKNHFEQEDGAARLGFKHEDIFRLEQLIEEKLTSMNSMRKKIDGSAKSSGAEKAAKIISSYL
jgi:UDP-N-acetylglucosamine--N-acetylmuramyl-(pentapeptide) pyrophosphoryl-undecaprenol N-acetylglucosamine transferase